MNRTTPEHPILDRVRERLNQSRYLTVSLLLHAVLIMVLGTLIITTRQKPDDFVPEGVVPGAGDVQVTTPLPPEERPREQVQLRQEADAPEAPVFSPTPGNPAMGE